MSISACRLPLRPDAAAAGALGFLLLAGGAPAQPTPAERAATSPAATTTSPFPSPAGSALEPATRLGPLHVRREGEGGWVAQADLGDALVVWLHAPAEDGPTLALDVAAAAYSRFDLERSDNEFQEVHYRVGTRLRAGRGPWSARFELFHASSHLGDELIQRTDRSPISTSREGLELLIQRRVAPGLRLHAGPGWLLRSSEGFRRASLRAGGEWRLRGRGASPFVAGELFAMDELAWSPTVTFEAGLGLGRRYRIAATWGSGPSRAEQFFREDETVWGLLFTARR